MSIKQNIKVRCGGSVDNMSFALTDLSAYHIHIHLRIIIDV